MEKQNNKITNNCEELNNIAEEPNNGVEEPNNVVEESNQGIISIVFELILKAQIKLFSRPLQPNGIVYEPNNVMEEPNNVVQKPHNVVVEPDNLVEEPNTVAEKSGIFTNCHNEWCLQKGLQKPQYTKCESFTNNGKTCKNPEIKYIYSYTVTVGFPWEFSSNNYEKWCEQLGGVYVGHTFGTRRGHPVIGCTLDAQGRMTDPRNWHWCEYWYDYQSTSNKFITSITCMN